MAAVTDAPKHPISGRFKLAVLPPGGATPQLPSPDQSGDPFESCQTYGRGRRLLPEEESSLVDICTAEMGSAEINDHRKLFWEEISEALYRLTHRQYFWQSCKRRMGRLIEAYQAYHNKFPSGVSLANDPLLREYELMSTGVKEQIGQLVDMDAEQTYCPVAEEQAKLDKEKEEAWKEFEDRRNGKLARVQKWLDSLPATDTMKHVENDFGPVRTSRIRKQTFQMFPQYKKELCRMESQHRNRSRSPCRGERKYRQRSYSPLARRPAPMMSGDERYNGDGDNRPVQSSLGRKRSRKLNQGTPDAAVSALEEFLIHKSPELSSKYLLPIIRKLAAHNPAVRDKSLSMMEESCNDMAHCMVSLTSEFLQDFFECGHGMPLYN